MAKSTGADSNLFYVDYQKNGCVKDCDSSGGGACGGPPSDGSTQMFTTAELCCKEKLSYVRDVICIANTNNAAAEGSEEWFVDYQENICVQDCAVDAAKPGCAGVLKDSSTATYASAEACCVAKLGWIDKTSCTVKSTGGTAAPDTGSDKWYVDYQSNSCAQDCEAVTATCTSPGKILSVTDTQTLYDDATACCKAKLSWMSEDLCVALSSGVFSDLFYVDYQNNKCQQDCDSTAAGAAASCTGHPTDMSVAMYATAAECCKGSLGWLSEDICVGNTNNVAPTGKFLVQFSFE